MKATTTLDFSKSIKETQKGIIAELPSGLVHSQSNNSSIKQTRIGMTGICASVLSKQALRTRRSASDLKVDLDAARNTIQNLSRRNTYQSGASSSSVILDNKYLLMSELGRGTMGMVFLAEDISLKRFVAIKFLNPELACVPEYAELFNTEAIGMARIKNPNVVHIYSSGTYGTVPFFVMEYLDGITLQHLIDSHNRLATKVPLEDTIEILIQTLSGLHAIHRCGIIHRDIKPSNIIIVKNPSKVVIADFGVIDFAQNKQKENFLVGSPSYMAPELILGQMASFNPTLTDIYSMGISAYELLTGLVPFLGETLQEVLGKHVHTPPPKLSLYRPDISPHLEEIILKSIHKDPQKRFQSSKEFLDALQAYQSERLGKKSPVGGAPKINHSIEKKSHPHAPPQTNHVFKATPNERSKKILIADANTTFWHRVKSKIKTGVSPNHIHVVSDGLLALNLLNEIQPDILVITASLPKISGFELLALIKENKRLKKMKIILAIKSLSKSDTDIFKKLNVSQFFKLPSPVSEAAEFVENTINAEFAGSPGV